MTLYAKCQECNGIGFISTEAGAMPRPCTYCNGDKFVPVEPLANERWELDDAEHIIETATGLRLRATNRDRTAAHNASVTRLQAQIDALTAQLAKAEAALPEISVLFALAEAGNVVESDIIEHDCRVLAERIRRYHADREGN